MDENLNTHWRKAGRNRLDDVLRQDIGLAVDAIVSGKDDPMVVGRVVEGLGRLSVFDVPMVARVMSQDFRETIGRRRTYDVSVWRRRLGLVSAAPADTIRYFSPHSNWLRLFHNDGRERQKALDAIDMPPPAGFWFAALGVRAADWAGEVRQAAVRCMERVAARIDAEVVIDGLLFLLNNNAREDNGFAKALRTELVTRAEIRAALLSRLLTSTEGAANRLFKSIVADLSLLDDDLPLLAEQARHPAIRARALRVLLYGHADMIGGEEQVWRDRKAARGLAPPPIRQRPVTSSIPAAELIAIGARDRAATVRKIAADGLIFHRASLADPGALLRAFDGEKHAAVRDRLDFVKRFLEVTPCRAN